MHVAEYFSLDDILLDQSTVPERTQPYRHNGRFKIQKNVQLKASNQPGAGFDYTLRNCLSFMATGLSHKPSVRNHAH